MTKVSYFRRARVLGAQSGVLVYFYPAISGFCESGNDGPDTGGQNDAIVYARIFELAHYASLLYGCEQCFDGQYRALCWLFAAGGARSSEHL